MNRLSRWEAGCKAPPGPVLRARYEVVEETPARVVIRDVGHDSGHPTITNDAEAVLLDVHLQLGGLRGRRLFYYDSELRCDELLHTDGVFVGFAPGPAELQAVRPPRPNRSCGCPMASGAKDCADLRGTIRRCTCSCHEHLQAERAR